MLTAKGKGWSPRLGREAKPKGCRVPVRRLLQYMKPHFWLFLFGPLLMVAEAVGEIVLPYIMRDIIQTGVPSGDTSYIVGKGIAMLATALIMLVAQAIGTKLCVKGSMRLGRDLRRDVFAKIQQFSASNMDKYSEPSLVMRLTNDVTQVQNVVLATAKIILKAPVLLILGCTTAFAMNQELSVVLIVTMPLMAAVVIFLSLRSFPKFDIMQRALDALNGKIQESLINVRVVKAFVRGAYEIERFKTSNERLKQTSTKAFTMSATITPPRCRPT